ncbi:hypothetical protein HPB48_006531 [Haemaphysalis longicornis]|uniref:Mitochondrial ATP synthase regulatory component factor B n=1 Tax=Haemaphysalis longicornis TaxID=44386 RepID=A0A9J6GKI0_HAELO|nr:hypothetical protein HPB48_006531 [Haemaphysalis longicornis]
MLRHLGRTLGSGLEATRANLPLHGSRFMSSDKTAEKTAKYVNTNDDYVAIDSRPNILETAGSFFKGLSPDFVSGMHKIPTYFTREATFERKLKREANLRAASQRFFPERHGILGPDLAAASFLVFRGARVKFRGKDGWHTKTEDDDTGLPYKYEPGWVLEAIDATDTELYYEGLDNLSEWAVHYTRPAWKGLKGASAVLGTPTWTTGFLDRLSQFRETLEHLDLSGCPQITERGLSALYRLRKLKTLTLGHLTHVPHLKLVALMLEEALPGCKVLGISYVDSEIPPSPERDEEELVDQQQKAQRMEENIASGEGAEEDTGEPTKRGAKQSA